MEAAEKIAVVTDTCCDLPREVFKQYPIFSVPLVVSCGTESYRDNIDITVEEVYARQKAEDFKTSLPARRTSRTSTPPLRGRATPTSSC